MRIVRDGVEQDAGPAKQRALLAALALHPNRVVAVDTLVDQMWPGGPPSAVSASLHGYVAGLRRVLEPDSDGPVPTGGAGHLGTRLRAADAARRGGCDRFDHAVRRRRPPGSATGPLASGAENSVAADGWPRRSAAGAVSRSASSTIPTRVAERDRLGELRLTAVAVLTRADLAGPGGCGDRPDLPVARD